MIKRKRKEGGKTGKDKNEKRGEINVNGGRIADKSKDAGEIRINY